MNPSPDGPFQSDLERVHWGIPAVTPEREDAWKRWKDDYLASCIDGWVSQGGSTDDLVKSAAVVVNDLGLVDALPWMPLGPALTERLGTLQLATEPNKELGSIDAKTRLISALRTTQTSSIEDRLCATAYQLGMSVARVRQIADHFEAPSHAPDAARGGRTGLYRHFDIDGVLLYVGISKSPAEREVQHEKSSPWFRFSCATTIEWFDSRTEAAQAERDAIRTETPIFNRTHNGPNQRAAVEYLFQALDSPAANWAAASEVKASS